MGADAAFGNGAGSAHLRGSRVRGCFRKACRGGQGVDRKLARGRNTGKPQEQHAVQTRPPGFGEQMQAFLRRNLNWFLVASFALLLLQDIFGTNGVLAMRRTQLQAKEVQEEIERLNKENQKLQNRVQHLKSDPA